MSRIWVTKADGTKQRFEKQKIVNTCLRMRTSREVAEVIADEVEKRVYDGISTRRILQMVFTQLRRHEPAFSRRINLRRAISLLRPVPDWEHYVQLLLNELGYTVTPNQIVRGRCVEHEIDAVARRDDETILVEIKHHHKHHTLTSLDVCRVIRATFEDLTEGFNLGFNPFNFTQAMIVCNTKFSHHARQYAQCRGIAHIGWNAPIGSGLDRLIEEKTFHPITLISGLDRQTAQKLGDREVLLLRQLREMNPRELSKKSGVTTEKLEELAQIATKILSN